MRHRRTRSWLGRLLGIGRPDADRRIDEELAFHLEMEAHKHRRAGLDEHEAMRRARLSFGGLERFKEECRDERLGSQIEMLMQDVHFTMRTLTKNWGFATAAILTLALGIGANTAIFSVIYGVLLSPLPYAHGRDLVLVQESAPGIGRTAVQASIPELYAFREQATQFDELVEYHTMFFVLLGRDEPERVQTGVVSDNFFDTLGVTALHGRTFVDGEDDLDSEPVLVLTYDYWQRAFGGDPDVIGRVFEMNTRPHTVVGILPPIPQFPNQVDVFMPTSACPFRASAERNMAGNPRAFGNLFLFGRLAEGASVTTASNEIQGLAERFASDHPDDYPADAQMTARAVDLKQTLTLNARPVLFMLLGTAGLVLLIACANVANLSLARIMRREQEVAVRAALGASRARLVRQLLTESTLLALISGAVGLVLAYAGLDLLIDFVARYTPRAPQVSIDSWVLAFTVGVSLLTGLAFGTLPALPATRNPGGALKEGARGTTGGGLTLRRGLVVAQVALSFVLLVGAGLTLRSLAALQRIDPGFETEHVLSARVSIDWTAYDSMDDAHVFLQELARMVGDSPLARSAALTDRPPYRSNNPNLANFLIEGRDPEATKIPLQVVRNRITPAYFDTLRIPLLAGRAFNAGDDHEATPVAIINENLARTFWPDMDPLGARVSFDQGDSWLTVVGVVGDTRLYGPESPVTPVLYESFGQTGMPTWLLVRTLGDPLRAARAIKEAAYSEGNNPISDIEPMATLRNDALASPRLTASLLGVFALLALLVTLTGIAGVMAYAVSQRTREMGLRLALGAQPNRILLMVLRQGMLQVAVGLLLGCAGAIAFGRLLRGMLFEIEASDPATFGLVVVALGVAAVVAVLVPARRAVSVDPVAALRSE